MRLDMTATGPARDLSPGGRSLSPERDLSPGRGMGRGDGRARPPLPAETAGLRRPQANEPGLASRRPPPSAGRGSSFSGAFDRFFEAMAPNEFDEQLSEEVNGVDV